MPNLILRFLNSSDFIGRDIDFITAGYLDHVEFGTPTGTWIGARAEGGVQERAADYAKGITLELRYSLPVSDAQYNAIMTFARAQIGKGYDFLDIASILVHANWHSADRWICSELVCAACETGGLYLLNVEPELTRRITPDRVHLSPELIDKMVYRYPALLK
jgi:hypothetical protein